MESKHKIILLSLVLGTFMTSLDATIVAVALPQMASEMGEAGHDTSNISWVLLIYTMMLCCFIMLWSKLGTNIGFRRVFITGIALFTASSAAIGLCGLSPGIGLGAVILLRAVQGLGAGMAIAMSLAMVSTYLPSEMRGTALGTVTLAASAGTAFGPALGGILTTFHWSYIFFINIPVGLVCILLSLRSMDSACEQLPSERKKLDLTGAVLLLFMLMTLIFYLEKGGEIGWTSETGILLILVGAIAAGLLNFWEHRCSDPIVSFRLLGEPNIMRPVISVALLFMAMAGSYLLLPYYFQYVKGMETLQYGFILIANSLGLMVTGPIVGRLIDKTGNCRIYLVSGCLVSALGFFLLMGLGTDSSLAYIILALFVMGAGLGMSIGSATNLAFGYIRPGENGLLSGLTNTFRQAGSSAGVAVMQAVFAAFIVVGPGMTVGQIIVPGFRHAFFMAVVFCLVAFVIGMGAEDAPKEGK